MSRRSFSHSDWKTQQALQEQEARKRAKEEADEQLQQQLRQQEESASDKPEEEVMPGEKWSLSNRLSVLNKYLSCRMDARHLFDAADVETLREVIAPAALDVADKKEEQSRLKAQHMTAVERRKQQLHAYLYELADGRMRAYREFCAEQEVKAQDEDFCLAALEVVGTQLAHQPAEPGPRKRSVNEVYTMRKYRFELFGQIYWWTGYGRKSKPVMCYMAQGNDIEAARLPRDQWLPPYSASERNKLNAIPEAHQDEADELIKKFYNLGLK